MSSWPTGTCFICIPAPCAITALYRWAFGSPKAGTIFFTLRTTKFTMAPLKPSMSPSEATTTCLIGVRAITSSSTCAKFSRITMVSAPESFNWCSSSRAVYSGFTFTTVQPARRVPYRQTGYCSTLGIISATRAPLPMPLDCNQAPKAADRVSSSANVIDLPMQWKAGRAANCRTL